MYSDIEIAQATEMQHIREVAKTAGVDEKYLEQYGNYKAKIDLELLKESQAENGKLILVTAITPTPAGEGKTTTTVGLADAMRRIGKNVVVALREPSLGPVFGVKGGAAGGGYAQVAPSPPSTSAPSPRDARPPQPCAPPTGPALSASWSRSAARPRRAARRARGLPGGDWTGSGGVRAGLGRDAGGTHPGGTISCLRFLMGINGALPSLCCDPDPSLASVWG